MENNSEEDLEMIALVINEGQGLEIVVDGMDLQKMEYK